MITFVFGYLLNCFGVQCATRSRVGQENICRNSTDRSRSKVVKISDTVLADTLNLSAMSCSNSPKRKCIKTANSSSATLSLLVLPVSMSLSSSLVCLTCHDLALITLGSKQVISAQNTSQFGRPVQNLVLPSLVSMRFSIQDQDVKQQKTPALVVVEHVPASLAAHCLPLHCHLEYQMNAQHCGASLVAS